MTSVESYIPCIILRHCCSCLLHVHCYIFLLMSRHCYFCGLAHESSQLLLTQILAYVLLLLRLHSLIVLLLQLAVTQFLCHFCSSYIFNVLILQWLHSYHVMTAAKGVTTVILFLLHGYCVIITAAIQLLHSFCVISTASVYFLCYYYSGYLVIVLLLLLQHSHCVNTAAKQLLCYYC